LPKLARAETGEVEAFGIKIVEQVLAVENGECAVSRERIRGGRNVVWFGANGNSRPFDCETEANGVVAEGDVVGAELQGEFLRAGRGIVGKEGGIRRGYLQTPLHWKYLRMTDGGQEKEKKQTQEFHALLDFMQRGKTYFSILFLAAKELVFW